MWHVFYKPLPYRQRPILFCVVFFVFRWKIEDALRGELETNNNQVFREKTYTVR